MISVFYGNRSRGLCELIVLRASGLLECRECPPHLGSAGRHSRRWGGTARCPAGSGQGAAASRSSSAHPQCSCSCIRTYGCPAQTEKENGQEKHLADIKLVCQATSSTAGEISLAVSRNGQTEKLLLTTKPNIYTCTWVLCWANTKA